MTNNNNSNNDISERRQSSIRRRQAAATIVETTADANDNNNINMSRQQQQRRPRGVLAMLNMNDNDDSLVLPYYPFNPDLLEETTHVMKHYRHRRRYRKLPRNDNDTNNNNDECIMSPTSFLNNSDCEFTLFFLADTNNLNTIRVRPAVVKFVQQTQGQCTCICIPNLGGIDNQNLLCNGTGFFCLPWSYDNRHTILTMLSAHVVPSVIVIENSTGRRLTDRGQVAIEASYANAKSPQEVLKQWRNHESGQVSSSSWSQTVVQWPSSSSSNCIIS